MLDVRQPDIVRPAVGAGLDMMRAAMIPAIVHARGEQQMVQSGPFAARVVVRSTNLTPQVFPFRHTTRQCFVVLKPSSDRSNLKAAV